jgi:hypothetical protein
MLRSINDPEHPLTLEELNVVEQSLIEVRKWYRVRTTFIDRSPASRYYKKVCTVLASKY